MAIIWTKDWTAADDGTVLKAVDLKNIQDDINTTGLADADAIQGSPVAVPTPSDDGKGLVYDDATDTFIYTNFSGLPAGLGPLPWPAAAAPAGWLLCYGQAVSRTTYAGLFAVISTTYGVGDGSTTFNLPDLRGRIPLGKDNMGGVSADVVTDTEADTIGGTFGAETHALTIAELAAHDHAYTAPSGGSTTANGGFSNSDPSARTGSTGSGDAHNNLQPSMTFNYIMKT